jgi:hypothetical protein
MLTKKEASELFEKIRNKIMKRDEVYRLIDGERDYQDKFYKHPVIIGEKEHSPEEWLMYMEDYIGEAKHLLSRGKGPVNVQAMSNIRKIAALAVAAMEEHDTPERIYVELDTASAPENRI